MLLALVLLEGCGPSSSPRQLIDPRFPVEEPEQAVQVSQQDTAFKPALLALQAVRLFAEGGCVVHCLPMPWVEENFKLQVYSDSVLKQDSLVLAVVRGRQISAYELPYRPLTIGVPGTEDQLHYWWQQWRDSLEFSPQTRFFYFHTPGQARWMAANPSLDVLVLYGSEANALELSVLQRFPIAPWRRSCFRSQAP